MGHPIFFLTPGGDFLADIIMMRLQNAGHEVVMATTVEHETRLAQGYFRVAILDSAHPGAFEVAALFKLHSTHTKILMLLTPANAGVSEFRFVGDEVLIEPFEVSDVADRAEDLIEMGGRTVLMVFPTTDDNVERAKNSLQTILEDVTSLDESTRFHLHVAFGEAIGNAALHGNRSRRDKLVKVLYYNDDNGVTLRVTDEGDGFDWQTQMANRGESQAIDLARERGGEGKLGGLGMNTMNKVCDLVKYNDSGNEVTLMKVLTPAAI